MTSEEMLQLLRDIQGTCDRYTPYLQIIPGVQEPDCTEWFQMKIDLAAAINELRDAQDS